MSKQSSELKGKNLRTAILLVLLVAAFYGAIFVAQAFRSGSL